MKELFYFNRNVKRIYGEKAGNARAYKEFGCPATPAPTPTVSVTDDCNTGVGAGLLNNQVGVGVGVIEVKIKDERKHRGKPPEVAGFSTPFPEGMSPSGSFILKILFQEVGYDRA